MEWLLVLMLVLMGVVLVVLEFLVFPGVNVAGVLGIGCIVAGIYFGYAFYGSSTGHWILLSTVVFCAGVTYYTLRTGTWRRLSLSSQVDGTIEAVDKIVKEGESGVTLGRMAPMGNVRIGEAIIEGESQSGYIEPNSEVVVVKVFKNKIIVKLKSV